MARIKVLCDFDGTTAKNDVGNLFFRTYAGERCHEFVRQWKQGKISSKECLTRECELTRITESEFASFVDGQELDPFFAGFVDFCRKRDIEIDVVSDGLDFYVERILRNSDLDVKARANEITFLDGNRIEPSFPYFDQGCGHCANCKGLHVREARKTHDKIVYVGDGMSDRCGAREADIVFAKRGRDLLVFCREAGIEHFEFDDFSDVQSHLRELLQK